MTTEPEVADEVDPDTVQTDADAVDSVETDAESRTDDDTPAVPPVDPPAASSRRPGWNSLVVSGVVLVVIATAAAVVFGVLWHGAAHDSALATSRARDDALRAAEQGSINLTTLDYRDIQQGLDRWKQSTTGGLYSQLTQGDLVSTFTKQAQQAKSITSGKVLDGVITQLDGNAAQAIVYMNVTVSAGGSKPTSKLVPLQWNLTDTGSGWKLSGLPQSSGTSGQ